MATLTLLLLGAWSGAVIAVDEPDPMTPAYFTFSEPVMESPVDEEESPVDEEEYPVEFTQEMRGIVEVGYVEATDPRASGRVSSVTNGNQLEVEGGGVAVGAARMRLANDGGAWSGTSHGVHFVAEGGGGTAMAILVGEGGYEGLTLLMVQYADDDVRTRRAVIIPSDQMPPMPGPVELE